MPSAKIGKPQLRILEAVAKYHELTAEQLSRVLNYTHRYTQLHCQKLADPNNPDGLKLLFAVPAERARTASRTGNPPYVYVLGKDGRKYLFEAGYDIWPRFRPSEETKRAGTPHSLAVNDVLIAAHLLNQLGPSIELAGYVHEREFQSQALQVNISQGGKSKIRNLRPDLWLDFRIPATRNRYCFCVEVNLTHVEERRWRDVIRTYCNCLPSYKERFGTTIAVIAVLIQTRSRFPRPWRERSWQPTQEELQARTLEKEKLQKRLSDLKRWTEKELTSLNLQNLAILFRFSASPIDLMSPLEIFCSPHFVQPFSSTPSPLIPVGHAS